MIPQTDTEVLNQEEIPLQPTAVKEEWKSFFKDLLSKCELEDQSVHNEWIRKCRKLELYFNNLVDLFWDESAESWVVPNWDELEAEGEVPPRIINIYRPHAESIVAALSVQVPSTLLFPEDADNPDDIDTAENLSNLAKIVQKHNNGQLLFIKLLTILFNQGTVFAYNYFKRDKSYGYFTSFTRDVVSIPIKSLFCASCAAPLGDVRPDEPLAEVQCPECGAIGTPEEVASSYPEEIEREEKKLKGRGNIDLFGPINVKTSYSARIQEHVGYLILKFDQSVALLRSVFCNPGPNGEPPLLETIEPRTADNTYDSWVRYPSIYLGNQPENTAIVKCVWYRNWQFELLRSESNQELIAELRKQFPNGCYVIYVNDEPAEIMAEDLDEHWTISYDPRSQALHGEPLGTNLAKVQDISAEINELELQHLEHGIAELFIASDAIDWDKYSSVQARPGQRVPTFKEAGKSIGENFFETRTATLSPELAQISQKYDNLGEFVTGDFPTVYGGQVAGSSTATEYTKSQSAALQRLGTIWKIAAHFWSQVIYKSTKEYASFLEYEEKLVERDSNGFSNTVVDPNRLTGNIGRVEPEFSDQLPVTWQQIRDFFVSIMEMKDENIMAMLSHPENFELVRKAIGVNDLFIPGSGDRNKQYREIGQLLQAAPIEQMMPDPMTGMPIPQLQPSVMPEEFDNHQVEAEICQVWLVSSKGQRAKVENPMGYQNVVAHWKAHNMFVMMSQQAAQESSQEGEVENAG